MRAELTGPRPPGTPDGKCIITELEDGTLLIDRADPRVLISAEIIDEVASGRARPEATLDRLNFTVPNGHVGAALKIRAANRTVIYRLTDYLPSVHGYVGEWPD